MSLFSQSIEWMGTNPWLSIVSFIIAVLGVALAIIFYVKGKKVKSPCYTLRSNNLVRDVVSRIEPLEMRYSGQQIKNLTITKIAFWNAGRDTINNQDVASADPLTVHVKEGYKILDTKILYEKNPTNQFSITTSEDRSYIALQFEYVDKGEGAVIQLIHTGISHEDIELLGTIKGAGKPTFKYSPTQRRHIAMMASFLTLILGVTSGYLLADIPTPFSAVAVIIGLTISVGLVTALLKIRIPKGFDVFEEDF